MKTENEIKALPLLEQQKLVVELRAIKPNDKAYPNAKAIIDLITGEKKWKEPKKLKVKNISGHEVSADETKIGKDAEAEVYIWQYTALARFLEPEDDIKEQMEAAGEEGREADKKANSKPAEPKVDIAKTVSDAIAKGFESIKGKAALLLLTLLMALSCNASAQVQTTDVGSAGGYHVYFIAGQNGSVGLIGTNSFATGVITTNQQIVPNWNYTNGVAYNSPITNNIYTTNVPGLISCVNNDLLNVTWAFNLNNSGTGTATLSADYSDDLITWRIGVLTASLTAAGTTQVSTNITLANFGSGYIRFNTVAYPSPTLIQTNVITIGGGKPKTGPF